ncbi:MAG TPA: TIGR03435 family protein, partial [Candidatus Sulfopaludibacter sp.]|nr:TIGR03435 family protein [Candidatus Sulfopaludibacter sp.]
AAGQQAFEVVSVKPHPQTPGTISIRFPDSEGLKVRGDRFADRETTVSDLIMEAYDMPAYRIIGAPDWANPPMGDHFDIDAKSAAVPTVAQLREMLQTLLAERFHLKLRRESKELPVYALVVAQSGPKLRQLREDEKAPTFANRPAVQPATLMASLPMLVQLIGNVVDRPVLDETHLAGRYEFANLDWRAFGIAKRAGTLDTEAGDSIFAALQRELGLKLEPRKDAVPVLVIEHVERPSAN